MITWRFCFSDFKKDPANPAEILFGWTDESGETYDQCLAKAGSKIPNSCNIWVKYQLLELEDCRDVMSDAAIKELLK